MLPEPKLTEEQKIDRMNFAFTVLTEKLNPNLVGFSDESRFQLDSNRRGVWHHFNRYNPRCIIKKSKYSPSLMIWGMIAKDFKSDLFFMEKSITKEYYKEIIIDSDVITKAMEVIGEDFIFNQDGATSHTRSLAVNAIRKHSSIHRL